MTNITFLDHLFFGIVLSLGLSLVLIILHGGIKFTAIYLKDGDIRHVFLTQSYFYTLMVIIEAILYMLIGCANDFCIISLQVFVFVNSFLYAQTRYTGRAALKLSRTMRANLFLATLTIFWTTNFFFAVSTTSTYVFLFDLSPYEKLSQIVSFLTRPMNGHMSDYAFIVRVFPPLAFNIFAIVIDFIEDRPFASKMNSAHMFIPTLLQAYLVAPIHHHNRVLDIILLIVMVFTVTMCMLREGYLIKYFNEMSTPEMLAHKLYKEIKKEDNHEMILLKQKMLIKMFSFREVEGFKNKKLQKYIQRLQLSIRL